jgi:hypothetical protein
MQTSSAFANEPSNRSVRVRFGERGSQGASNEAEITIKSDRVSFTVNDKLSSPIRE